MEIKVTGDLRQVANSAWISTLDEIKAQSRNDEDAKRVVKFLVENHHTSPFESVTLGFKGKHNDLYQKKENPISMYFENPYGRLKSGPDGWVFVIDLLNFIKDTVHFGYFQKKPWQLFEKACPDLAEICSSFKLLGGKNLTSDVSTILGDHGMKVELINYHKEEEQNLSRATWRILCPLSIAVQILRHRKGSYNMTSGRYRTLRQDVIGPVSDCAEICEKFDIDLNRYLGSVDGVMLQYSAFMKKAQEAKEKKIISNTEYKRIREFSRYILPEGRMTELYVTYFLDDFYDNYVVLRDSEHAQVEHVWIAQEMQRVLEQA